jgi:hypothetical protein
MIGRERLDRGRHDALHGAAPSGVDGGNHSRPSIREQHGSAVGDADDQRN